jgi:hypothetical protein
MDTKLAKMPQVRIVPKKVKRDSLTIPVSMMQSERRDSFFGQRNTDMQDKR